MRLTDEPRTSPHFSAARYRSTYRQTWSKDATASVLANVQNAMVLDDHEVTDDWGDTAEDQRVGSTAGTDTPRNFVASCAYQVCSCCTRRT